MADLKGVLTLVADKLISVEQGELLVMSFLSQKLPEENKTNERPTWLTASEEDAILALCKKGIKLQGIKELKDIARMRGQDMEVINLRWCKEYCESIVDR